VTLGPLMALSSTPYVPPPMPFLARTAEAGMGGDVPIIVGEQPIQVTVSAVYEIR
jgi:uncharacterized protein YggE